MHLSVYLPLLLSAAFGLLAPAAANRLPRCRPRRLHFARRSLRAAPAPAPAPAEAGAGAVAGALAGRAAHALSPAAATWLLSVGGLVAAAASTASLALLGMTLIGQTPSVAAYGHWSDAALRYADPVATPVAVAALLVLSVLALRCAVAGVRRLLALRAAYRLAAVLPTAGGELAVVDDNHSRAYAVPGRPGRIVVSAALLRRLDATERRALLAHERSHLVHRHHLHQTLAVLAAAASPLLGRVPAAVALATERWADEDAAATCRRETVATLLTRAAAGPAPPTLDVVMAAAAGDVDTRLRALRAPAPKLTLWRIVVLLGLVVGTAAAVLHAAHDTEQLFELAQFAYRAGQR